MAGMTSELGTQLGDIHPEKSLEIKREHVGKGQEGSRDQGHISCKGTKTYMVSGDQTAAMYSAGVAGKTELPYWNS